MTSRTMQEGYELLTGLDSDAVNAFLSEYKSGNYESETNCPHYDDIYEPISRFEFTDFDEDEEEICSSGFYTKCIRWSDGTPNCYIELARIVDETGF